MINNTLKTLTFYVVLFVTMVTVDGLIIDKAEFANSKKSSYTVETITANLGGGTGSAVAVNDSGRLVTNAHVIDNAIIIKVTGSDGRSYEARVVKADYKLDLAELQITSKVVTKSVIFGDDATFGDKVYAVGAALGVPMQVSVGVASDEVTFSPIGRRTLSDARIEHGNSGGGLFGSTGKLVGINTNIKYNHDRVLILKDKKVSESENMYYANGQGIALSIPVSVVKEFLGVL